MSNLTIFDFEGCEIRVIGTPDEPRFVAADVCRVLGLANVSDAMTKLDADEKGIGSTDTPGGPQDVLTVDESGFYHLTFRSRKPSAAVLRRKVTRDILPTIRRTGVYVEGSAGLGSLIRAEARAAAAELINVELKMLRTEIANTDLWTLASYAKAKNVALTPKQSRAIGSGLAAVCRSLGLRMGSEPSAHRHGKAPRTFPKSVLSSHFSRLVDRHVPDHKPALLSLVAAAQ